MFLSCELLEGLMRLGQARHGGRRDSVLLLSPMVSLLVLGCSSPCWGPAATGLLLCIHTVLLSAKSPSRRCALEKSWDVPVPSSLQVLFAASAVSAPKLAVKAGLALLWVRWQSEPWGSWMVAGVYKCGRI